MAEAWQMNDLLFAREPMKVPVPAVAVPGPPPGLEAFLASKDESVMDDDISTQVRDDGSRAGSRASSDVGGTGSFSECKFLLEDLQEFRMLLLGRVNSAITALSKADKDLAVAVGHLPPQIEELVNVAREVASELTSACQNEMLIVSGYGALGHSEPGRILCEALAVLSSLRKRARKVRAEYLAILERIRYVALCNEAVWADTFEGTPDYRQAEPRSLDLWALESFSGLRAVSEATGSELLELSLGHLRAAT
ncbi:unnamed protein product, partial [Effrenium voratum]